MLNGAAIASLLWQSALGELGMLPSPGAGVTLLGSFGGPSVSRRTENAV